MFVVLIPIAGGKQAAEVQEFAASCARQFYAAAFHSVFDEVSGQDFDNVKEEQSAGEQQVRNVLRYVACWNPNRSRLGIGVYREMGF